MAEQRPLCLIAGVLRQLPAGDTLPSSGGGGGLAQPPAAVLTDSLVVAETVVARWALPANFFAAGQTFLLRGGGQRTVGLGTLTFRVRVGPLGTVADPVAVVFSASAAAVVNAYANQDIYMSIPTATTATAVGTAQLAAGIVGPVTGAYAPATINPAVPLFVSLTLTCSVVGTYVSRFASLFRMT